MANQQVEKRKIAFIAEYCPSKGSYPFERIITLHELLEGHDLCTFIQADEPFILQLFHEANIKPILFNHYKQLQNTLRNMQFDLIIIDGKDILREQLEPLLPFAKCIFTFDQLSDSAELAQYNLYSIAPEIGQFEQSYNAVVSSTGFAIPENLRNLTRQQNKLLATPHIVIYFEDGDINNLTYRTLRHLTLLQIPLQITILLDELYTHPTDDLQMMALSRKRTKIVRGQAAFPTLLSQAHIVIGNAMYTPYKAATLGVPYIALAQNELQVQQFLVTESNGFIHLGLGRKIKQSTLQNAVMELLLHEERSSRAIRRQKMLQLSQNNELLKALLHDLAIGEYKITL